MRLIVTVIICLIVGGLLWSIGDWYLEKNYTPKPEPLDARSVIAGIQKMKAYYDATYLALQRNDSSRVHVLDSSFTKLFDSLKTEAGIK